MVIHPYHANVPSFGEWGFVLATSRPAQPASARLRVATRFLSDESLPTMFIFPKDLAKRETELNRLDRPVLLDLYRRGYGAYNQ